MSTKPSWSLRWKRSWTHNWTSLNRTVILPQLSKDNEWQWIQAREIMKLPIFFLTHSAIVVSKSCVESKSSISGRTTARMAVATWKFSSGRLDSKDSNPAVGWFNPISFHFCLAFYIIKIKIMTALMTSKWLILKPIPAWSPHVKVQTSLSSAPS